MVALKAFFLRWTARALRFCLPKAPWGDRLYSSIHFAFLLGGLPRFNAPGAATGEPRPASVEMQLGRLFTAPNLTAAEALSL